MKKTKTPELDKMLAIQGKSQTVGEFLEWLGQESLLICECDEGKLYATRSTTEQLLADFFEIDLNKCEQERQQILADLKSDGR